jgi:hypothetical protein
MRESDVPGCCYWFTCQCCWSLRFTTMVKHRELMQISIVLIVPIMFITTGI